MTKCFDLASYQDALATLATAAIPAPTATCNKRRINDDLPFGQAEINSAAITRNSLN
jgi:hypothetical protein